jgi:hypothetical protein
VGLAALPAALLIALISLSSLLGTLLVLLSGLPPWLLLILLTGALLALVPVLVICHCGFPSMGRIQSVKVIVVAGN